MKRISLTVAGLMLVGTMSASAHHSFNSFWFMDKTASIEGVVTEIKLVNPHPEMKVEVTESNGTKTIWNITGRATGSGILKAGWTPETLPVGTKIRSRRLAVAERGRQGPGRGQDHAD